MFSIILSDLVPLVERGVFQGLVVIAWAFAAAIGPVVVSIYVHNICGLPYEGIANAGYCRVAPWRRMRPGDGSSVSLHSYNISHTVC